jgi:hypothetical protein
VLGQHCQGHLRLIDEVDGLFVSIIPQDEVQLREIPAEQWQQLFLPPQEVGKGVDEEGPLCFRLDFEEGVDNARGVGLHHQHRQQGQFVLATLAIRLARGLRDVSQDLPGDFEGIGDILQQAGLVGFEEVEEVGVLE